MSISRRTLFSKLNRTFFRAVESATVTPALLGQASGPVAAHASAVQSALTRYCTDLTQHARAGEIDPVIGREHEIRTLVDILLRRRKNNPLLTGETGVGKTAVVEGLAPAIASGDVPEPLRDARPLSLDVGALTPATGRAMP